MGGHHLDVVHLASPIGALIFNAEVGTLHVVVDDRQVVLDRPLRDFFAAPIGPPVAVCAVAVSLLQKRLVLAFQLVIEDDPLKARALCAKPFRSTLLVGLVGLAGLAVLGRRVFITRFLSLLQ